MKVFFSRRICQDPLEKFFGCQRQMGGTHDHTTAKEFQGNTQALRVVNSFCRGTVKGNCRGNDDLQTMEYENYDLPKRSSSRKRLRTVETPLNEHNTPGKMLAYRE